MNKSMQNLCWMHVTFPWTYLHHQRMLSVSRHATLQLTQCQVEQFFWKETNCFQPACHYATFHRLLNRFNAASNVCWSCRGLLSRWSENNETGDSFFFVLDASIEMMESAVLSPFPSVVWGSQIHHRNHNNLRRNHFIIETEYSVKSHLH